MDIKRFCNKLLKRFKWIHYLNFHNDDCRRRVFTTKRDYLCLITGNTHKKL